LQFDPESSPELALYHAHPQVALAYLKYQYAVGDEVKRRDAFSRLQVSLFLPEKKNFAVSHACLIKIINIWYIAVQIILPFFPWLNCSAHHTFFFFLWGTGVVCAACYYH
jgi:hypothetical protein